MNDFIRSILNHLGINLGKLYTLNVALSYISCINLVKGKMFRKGNWMSRSNSWWNMFDLINLLNANFGLVERGWFSVFRIVIECHFLCHVSIATLVVVTFRMWLFVFCCWDVWGDRFVALRILEASINIFLFRCRFVNYFMTCCLVFGVNSISDSE